MRRQAIRKLIELDLQQLHIPITRRFIQLLEMVHHFAYYRR
jgi:hypothetical protein